MKMKDDIILKTLAGILLVGIFSCCSLKREFPSERHFPEDISPIYFVDIIQIESPVVVILDSVPYIMPQGKLEGIDNSSELIENNLVIRYLTPLMTRSRSLRFLDAYMYSRKHLSLYYNQVDSEFDLDFVVSRSGKLINDICIYEFNYQPKSFVLALIAKDEILHRQNDRIFGAEYSSDYILAVSPVFTIQDRKKIEHDIIEYVESFRKIQK